MALDYTLYNLWHPSVTDPRVFNLVVDDGSYIYRAFLQQRRDGSILNNFISRGRPLCESKPGTDINSYYFTDQDVYGSDNGKYQLFKIPNKPGKYYPRIFRPMIVADEGDGSVKYYPQNTVTSNPEIPYYYFNDKITMISAVQQYGTLVHKAKTIFDCVYPDEQQLKCYGHEIRNVFILVCTEIEAQLKGIMQANGSTSKRLTMKEYAELVSVMHLRSYNLQFVNYPHLRPFSPFEYWSSDKPLDWYQAYNQVKHDREGHFADANIGNLLHAIAGLSVLLVAQYGFNIPTWRDTVGEVFYFASTPHWEPADFYLPPFAGMEWEEVGYFES